MKFSLTELNLIYSDQLCLEFSSQDQDKAWPSENEYSNDSARWNAYLNQLCLSKLIHWFPENTEAEVKVFPSDKALPNFWEFVNGTAINIGEKRIVLIPSEANNTEEFCVTQEWVDIPSWAADYYLAVQIHPDDGWLRVWGYATHQQLKQPENYDRLARTYCLEGQDLIADLEVLWIALELGADEKALVKSLPILSTKEAEKLVQQLSRPSPCSPRLKINFEQWAAILSEPKSRQQLYNLRNKKVVKLSNWLQNNFVNTVQAGWQTIEALLAPEQQKLALRYRSSSVTEENTVRQAKLIDLGVQLGNKSLVMLVALTADADDKVGIRVQVHPPEGEKHLPSYVRLALLESGEIRQEVQSRNLDNFIQLKRFKGIPGTSFSVQVALGDVSLTEEFEI
ncbi:DUF1822 family protein [Microseira wollei]|nr:DUF1822 family protein [Microseira wollei]